MKKTNIILGIVIAVFVICAAVILIVAAVSNMEKETIPVNVDFEALSANIEEATDIDSSKMEEITIEDLEEDFLIDSEWVVQVIGVKPYVNVTASMYVIVETTEEHIDDIISAFEKYGEDYEEMWQNYLAEEYELVQNRLIGSKGNYVYFIVSDYASDIVDLIK